MQKDFLKLQTDTLLREFGAGGHKPGSGSAAALQGLPSAQLVLTVIDLTLDPKRALLFASVHSKFQKACANIVDEIYPELERLFHEDAKAFDNAIQLRVARDGEFGVYKKG